MAEKQGKSNSKKSSSRNKKSGKASLFEFLSDSRTRTVLGIFFIVVSAFLTLSFISHLVEAGINDQSQLQEITETLVDPEEKVDNWMGKIGAIVAEKFVHSWFGISAFLFPFLFLLIGFQVMFRKALLPIAKSLKHSLFFLYFVPLAMGYLFTENANLSGSLGFQLNRWTNSLIGSAGTAMLLLFLTVVYVAVVFNFSVDAVKSLLAKKESDSSEEQEETDEEFEPVADITVKTNELDLSKEEETAPEPKPEAEEEPEKELELETSEPEPNSTQKITQEDEESSDVAFEVEKSVVKEEVVDENEGEDMGAYDPTLDLSHYKKPTLDLLEAYGKGEVSVDKEELEMNKNKIVSTLKNYNIEIERIKATIGPTVTLYEIVPAPGIRISKIKNLEDDIALSLSALGIRIIAPIPGKGTIGIEVPNQNPDTVSMKAVLSSEKFQHAKMELPIALGKTISNETFVTDLTKMPHLSSRMAP